MCGQSAGRPTMSGRCASWAFRPARAGASIPGSTPPRSVARDVDAAGSFAVTGSDDRTVRVWSLTDGSLRAHDPHSTRPGRHRQGLRRGAQPGWRIVAAGGWTRIGEARSRKQIYIFSAISGMLRQRIVGLPALPTDLAFSRDGGRLAGGVGGPSGGFRPLRAKTARSGWSEWLGKTAYLMARVTESPLRWMAGSQQLAGTAGCGSTTPNGEQIGSSPRRTASLIGVAFNPMDGRLAVGFHDAARCGALSTAQRSRTATRAGLRSHR